MDVFDARGAAVHVDGELTYIYTPSELALSSLFIKRSKVQRTGFKRQKQKQPRVETLSVSLFPEGYACLYED